MFNQLITYLVDQVLSDIAIYYKFLWHFPDLIWKHTAIMLGECFTVAIGSLIILGVRQGYKGEALDDGSEYLIIPVVGIALVWGWPILFSAIGGLLPLLVPITVSMALGALAKNIRNKRNGITGQFRNQQLEPHEMNVENDWRQ